jgi:UDP-glucose 4-epimerase
MKSILITGVNGFVGSFLSGVLATAGYEVRGSVRDPATAPTHCATVAVGEIHAATDWSRALPGIDCVVHLAGSAQAARASAANALVGLRPVNVDGAANLARQAAACGVKRFIFLSSIKVNGERTAAYPFQADDPAHPEEPYAQSKWEAEQALREIGAATGMEIVVIRPPLIYGPGAKGNVLRLLRLVDKRWPLPLGGIRNARSLVGIGNLCDLIRVCIEHPNAAGEVFLASDGDDLSTPQLLRYMAEALHRPLRLLPVPVAVLHGLGKLCGVSASVARLTGDLRVDIGKNRERLGWIPPYPVVEGLREMAEAYKNPHLINL